MNIGTHTLTIAGGNDVELDDVTGIGTITKTGAGDLDLIGTIGAGAIALNANDGTTKVGADQTLAALNIGASATVVLGAIAPGDSLHAIPEPGVVILLAFGLLGIFGRRHRGIDRTIAQRAKNERVDISPCQKLADFR